jgi:hypothetical protein
MIPVVLYGLYCLVPYGPYSSVTPPWGRGKGLLPPPPALLQGGGLYWHHILT